LSLGSRKRQAIDWPLTHAVLGSKSRSHSGSSLAAQHPTVVKDLSATLQAWTAALPKEYIKSRASDD
jgi:hypothetical protein